MLNEALPQKGEDVCVTEWEVDASAVKSFVMAQWGQLVEEEKLSPALGGLRFDVDSLVVVGDWEPRLCVGRESGVGGVVPLLAFKY